MLQTRADALGHDGGLGALLGDVGHEGFEDVSLAPSGGVSTEKECGRSWKGWITYSEQSGRI